MTRAGSSSVRVVSLVRDHRRGSHEFLRIRTIRTVASVTRGKPITVRTIPSRSILQQLIDPHPSSTGRRCGADGPHRLLVVQLAAGDHAAGVSWRLSLTSTCAWSRVTRSISLRWRVRWPDRTPSSELWHQVQPKADHALFGCGHEYRPGDARPWRPPPRLRQLERDRSSNTVSEYRGRRRVRKGSQAVHHERGGKTMYADLPRMETLVMDSDLDWTIVRPSGLFETPMVTEYRVAESFSRNASPRGPTWPRACWSRQAAIITYGRRWRLRPLQ